MVGRVRKYKNNKDGKRIKIKTSGPIIKPNIPSTMLAIPPLPPERLTYKQYEENTLKPKENKAIKLIIQIPTTLPQFFDFNIPTLEIKQTKATKVKTNTNGWRI